MLVFEQQKYPSEREMMEQAIRQTFAGLAAINEQQEIARSLSKLCIGTECGASDGFSEFPPTRRSGRSPTYWSVSEDGHSFGIP